MTMWRRERAECPFPAGQNHQQRAIGVPDCRNVMQRAELTHVAPVEFPAHIMLVTAAPCGVIDPWKDLMLDGLRQFIADIVAPHAQDRAFGDSDYRLAATALLVHVVSLDGQPTAAEQRKLHALIESHFGLDRGTADRPKWQIGRAHV